MCNIEYPFHLTCIKPVPVSRGVAASVNGPRKVMSALPPKADMCDANSQHQQLSLDHFVCALLERRHLRCTWQCPLRANSARKSTDVAFCERRKRRPCT